MATSTPIGAGVGRCAVLVDDAWQGRGLGTALVRRLADTAAEQGLVALTGPWLGRMTSG